MAYNYFGRRPCRVVYRLMARFIDRRGPDSAVVCGVCVAYEWLRRVYACWWCGSCALIGCGTALTWCRDLGSGPAAARQIGPGGGGMTPYWKLYGSWWLGGRGRAGGDVPGVAGYRDEVMHTWQTFDHHKISKLFKYKEQWGFKSKNKYSR